jgi:hypothetical protein
MSAYASLPGLPFFSFGGSSPTKKDDESSDDNAPSTTSSQGEQSSYSMGTQKRQPISSNSSLSCPDLSIGASALTLASGNNYSSSGSSLSDNIPKLPQSTQDNHLSPSQQSIHSSPSSSPASEIFIAINNARVDTVQLIQSLTTRGSNIARRTANFISRTSDNDDDDATASASNDTNHASYKRSNTTETTETEDSETVHSKPSLCYEDDSDDDDDEMSFYDYGDEDDYNHPPSYQDRHNNNNNNNNQREEDDHHHSISSKSQDEEAIQFELFINCNGREYRAFRAFSTFVQLRNDLLRDRTVPSTVSIPELPSIRSHSNNYHQHPRTTTATTPSFSNGGFHALARSGFAMLQATAKMYCPVMELWLRTVVEAVPSSSPILNKFLWEPLGSTTVGWNDLDETSMGGGGGSCSGMGGEDVLGKSPQPPPPRCKTRHAGTSGLRYRSKSYNTSLSSITELLDES